MSKQGPQRPTQELAEFKKNRARETLTVLRRLFEEERQQQEDIRAKALACYSSDGLSDIL